MYDPAAQVASLVDASPSIEGVQAENGRLAWRSSDEGFRIKDLATGAFLAVPGRWFVSYRLSDSCLTWYGEMPLLYVHDFRSGIAHRIELAGYREITPVAASAERIVYYAWSETNGRCGVFMATQRPSR